MLYITHGTFSSFGKIWERTNLLWRAGRAVKNDGEIRVYLNTDLALIETFTIFHKSFAHIKCPALKDTISFPKKNIILQAIFQCSTASILAQGGM